MSDSATQCLSVLSANMWGPPPAKYQRERFKHLGAASWLRDYDVVLLQEVFTSEQYHDILASGARKTHPHHHWFKSGLSGSGLVVLSRHRIVDRFFEVFQNQGHAEKFYHADYYAAKGVGFIKVEVPGLPRPVSFYCTHLHASYDKLSRLDFDFEKERYAHIRTAQMAQMAKFISLTSTKDDLVVVAGDFNAGTKSYEITLFEAVLSHAGLHLTSSHQELTYTVENAFVHAKRAPMFSFLDMDEDLPQQLDYIYTSHQFSVSRAGRAHHLNDEVRINASVSVPLSDHCPVEAVLKLTSAVDAPMPRGGRAHLERTIHEAKHLILRGVERAERQGTFFTRCCIAAAVIGVLFCNYMSFAVGAIAAWLFVLGPVHRHSESRALQEAASWM